MKPSIPYIAVEYIKSSGGAYIDTGLSLSLSSVDWSVDLSFGDNIAINQHQFMFGAVYQGNMLGVSQGAFLVLRPGWHTSQGVTSLFSPGDRVVLRLVRDQGLSTLYANGVAVATSGEVPAYDMGTFCLLWSNLTEFTQAYYPYLLHGASSGNGEFDLIPVRFINEQGVSEGAMYDRVTGSLFRNAGTGSFVIGPDKHPQTFTPIMHLHNYPKKNAVPTAKDYVQDGLIAMWDGIENAGWGTHDASATVWKDLSGNGHDLTIAVNNFQDNCYVCTGIENGAYGAFQTDGTTYEGCIKTASGEPGAACILYPGMRNKGLYCSGDFTSYGDFINTIVNEQENNYFSQSGNILSLSCCYSTSFQLFINGQQQSPYKQYVTLSGAGSSRGTNTVIGSAQYNNAKHKFKGTIYNLRLYSRALTAEEIAANYAVDKVRFNLPDPA